jgi:hypothetical protein
VAKQTNGKTGTSRIRFIMLEAEIPEGDLSQITAAIQNALKPPATIIQQRIQEPSQPAISNSLSEDDHPEAEDNEEFGQNFSDVQEVKKPKRESKPRSYPTPKVLDLDLTSDPSFESYIANKTPKTDVDRFLIIAAWFKENRQTESITANHVYTCYRSVKWPTAIEDFSSPLRGLKKSQLMTSKGTGLYAINHLGIAKVEKLERE